MSEMNDKLDKEQLRELKWFCKNVTVTRQEFYQILDRMNAFKAKIDRLDKLGKDIKKYAKDNDLDIESHDISGMP